jgi:uncharacterized protein YjbI with pentapeptide repeats
MEYNCANLGFRGFSRKRVAKVSEQDERQTVVQQRPATHDQDEWKAYWKTQGQSWRTEPEIDAERQKYLAERRSITPDIKKGIYPFKDIKLSRADVEWLLATHENGRGPVDWSNESHLSDESQRKRDGLDLRGADLSEENLRGLPLACMQGGLAIDKWLNATEEQRTMATVSMQKSSLYKAQLQGAVLLGAQFQKASLFMAQLQGADLGWTQLQGANLEGAQLQGASLYQAQMQGAYLCEAQLDRVNFAVATLSDEKYGPARLADVIWGEINLAVVDWGLVTRLGDEKKACQKKDSKGKTKDKQRRVDEYKQAVRANRQLAVVLRDQGLNEDAARFAYRAQILQREVLRRQGKFVQYLFSLFLDLLTGYGYKPIRSFITYALVISLFAFIYFLLGSHLAWNEAIVISMTAFHGRGFFPAQFKPGDPQALVAAIEAFVGLLIEVTFIATLTQRLFGK